MNPLKTILASGLLLRCPACHQGPIFRGFFAIHPACSQCGQTFYLAPGEFTGGVYLNYGVTAILATAGYFLLESLVTLPVWLLTTVLAVFGAVFPFLFLRNSRACFMAVLYLNGALKDERTEG